MTYDNSLINYMAKNSTKHVVKRDTKSETKSESKSETEKGKDVQQKAEKKVGQKAKPRNKKNNKSNKTDVEKVKEAKVDNTNANNAEENAQAGDKKKGIPEELERELKFKAALNELKEEIKTQTKVLKDLKSGVKKIETSYQHDINKAVKAKRRKNGPNKPTGFVKEIELPKELADLINVPEGTKISMPSYTKKLYEMLKRENLFYENDGRVLRANDQIKKVFNLPDSVNESTDYKDKNGFNFYTLQKHIAAVNKKARAMEKAKDSN